VQPGVSRHPDPSLIEQGFPIGEEIGKCNGVGGILPDRDLHAVAEDTPAFAGFRDVVVDEWAIHVVLASQAIGRSRASMRMCIRVAYQINLKNQTNF
jgi:hypothetical protein